ncbi:MAG: aminotransferase class III-fold pyridoxal phosphate-dependent enzyme [Actinomycetota bacterium]|nr:aminotransferase class III-fold pyridoxal phosphate-dependent enzyme [Actinomycetota bacterium]
MDETVGRKRPGDPLEAAPPAFSPPAVAAAAKRLFGLTGAITSLDSERDQNLRVVSDQGRPYLLKISNPADSPGVIEMQTQALLHIIREVPELPVMRPLPTLEGALHGTLDDADAHSHLVRLFTFLPGRMSSSIDLDRGAMRGFGSMVARMGLALRGFWHPAGGYKILWDLKHTAELRPFLDLVADDERRSMCARTLDRLEEHTLPSLPGLRAQIIHNDLTLDNVLLDATRSVSGIVDFGDLTHTALIGDLAIALVSLMWERPEPFEAAEAAIAGYRLVSSIEDAEARLLGDLVSARLLALILIANWRVARYPENSAYIMANVDLAWRLLQLFDALGSSQVARRLGAACLDAGTAPSRPGHSPTEELFERRRRVLGPALSPLSYDRPLHLVRGEGCWMFDSSGTRYLDAYNNVPVVGHGHPRVVRAIAEQSRTLNTNTRYLHQSVIELAERIVATMPEGLDTVLFFNSGSEANDVVWRLATAFTGGTGAIVTANAYHGVTMATLALSPEEWIEGESPPHVETVPAPDGYRGIYRRESAGWAERYAGCVGEAVARMQSRNHRPAAFYVDCLFTSDGIFNPPPAYLQNAAEGVHREGGLVVADEVQSGFGRTGAHLWSFQAAGIVPDFVTLGKPMGNGHPIAAVVTRAEVAERFASRSDIFSTFGGNPVASRAGLAVLDVLEDEALQKRAGEVGNYLHDELTQSMQTHGSIGDVRGVGLMLGVELVEDRQERRPHSRLTRAVMNRMKELGVLVGATGPDDNILKIRPPLVINTAEADLLVRTLHASLADMAHSEVKGAVGGAPDLPHRPQRQ